jgi:hypothetical protein
VKRGSVGFQKYFMNSRHPNSNSIQAKSLAIAKLFYHSYSAEEDLYQLNNFKLRIASPTGACEADPPLKMNDSSHMESKNRISATIADFVQTHNKLPGRNHLVKLANCSRRKATEALTALRGKIVFAKFPDANDIYRTRLSTSFIPSEVPEKLHAPKAFTRRDQANINLASSVLAKRENIHLITLTIPDSSEESDRLVCRHSDAILDAVIERIKKVTGPFSFIGRWERTKKKTLHLHLLLEMPTGRGIGESELRRIWASVLPTQVLKGKSHNQLIVEAKPFRIHSGIYKDSYLAKRSQTFARVARNEDRLTPQSWYRTSEDLKPTEDFKAIRCKLPMMSAEEGIALIEKLQAELSTDWSEVTNPYRRISKSFRASLSAAQMVQAENLLRETIGSRMHAIRQDWSKNHSQKLLKRDLAHMFDAFLVIELNIDGQLSLRVFEPSKPKRRSKRTSSRL